MSWLEVRRDRPWALSECCSGHCGSSLGRGWGLPAGARGLQLCSLGPGCLTWGLRSGAFPTKSSESPVQMGGCLGSYQW